jgi:hypothetical protein
MMPPCQRYPASPGVPIRITALRSIPRSTRLWTTKATSQDDALARHKPQFDNMDGLD